MKMKIKNRTIKAIIFDLDGTLLDSCGIWSDVDKQFFEKRGLTLTKDYEEAIGHIGLDKAADYTIKRYHLQEKKKDIIKEWKDGVCHLYANSVKLKPHAKEFLTYLKENNIPFCVATANDEDCYKPCLINNEIYDLFDFILEVNQFPFGKENPEIFLSAAKRLGVEPNECAVFEDLLMPINTAINAGFITFSVYEKLCKEEKQKEEISFMYIKDYQEIIDLLNKGEK